MLVMLISMIFSLYGMVVLLRVLFQFIRADYFNPLSQFVAKLTDYPCKKINRIVPRFAPIDVSAIVLFIVLEVIKLLIIGLLKASQITMLGMLIATVCDSISQFLNLYVYIILITAFASWFAPQNPHPSLTLLKKLADPVLTRARRFIPPFRNIDFSPVIVIIMLKLIDFIILMPLLAAKGMI